MGATPTYGLRFQELGDAPHGPNLGADLAADVEAELERIDGDVTGLDGRVTALENGDLIQYGVVNIVLVGEATDAVDVIFPEPFGGVPRVFANSPNSLYGTSCSAATSTQVTVRARHVQNNAGDANLDCDWIAIGPRA